MHDATLLRDPGVVASLEMRALEKMARALCEHTRQIAAAAGTRGALGTREAKLQVEVFAERCAQAAALLEVADPPVQESRIARLQQLVEALELSRRYFRGLK